MGKVKDAKDGEVNGQWQKKKGRGAPAKSGASYPDGLRDVAMATNFGITLAANGHWREITT